MRYEVESLTDEAHGHTYADPGRVQAWLDGIGLATNARLVAVYRHNHDTVSVWEHPGAVAP